MEVAGIKVTMVQAFHSAGVGSPPCGFIITTEDGKRIYHAGDTGVFADMKLLGGQIYPPLDLALIPIGSVFVMDPLQAAWAVEMLKPKKVVPPMHYRTFPVLVQDASEFAALAKEKAPEVEVLVLEPGGSQSSVRRVWNAFLLWRPKIRCGARAALLALALKTAKNDTRRGVEY